MPLRGQGFDRNCCNNGSDAQLQRSDHPRLGSDDNTLAQAFSAYAVAAAAKKSISSWLTRSASS
jgi:hypothetical protein